MMTPAMREDLSQRADEFERFKQADYLRKMGEQGAGLAKSVARGVPQMATGLVDLAAMPFEASGMIEPGKAVGSTKWLEEKGYLPPPQEGFVNQTAEMLASGLDPSTWASHALPLVAGIGKTAYHGSPHFFNKFDIEKLGAGEGNQVYGVGAGYTAEARPVAEGYRKRLSSIGDPYTYEYAGQTFFDPQMYQGKMPADPTSHAVRLAYHQNPSVARQIAKEGLADAKAGKPYALEMGGEDYYSKMLDVAKGLKKSDIKAQQGFLYKGDIPDEIIPKMLDWDNPVPDEVRGALSQKAMEQWGSGVTGTSGEKLYKEIAKNFEWAGSKNPMLDASNWLQEQGMTGIKYFDAGSRKKAEGTQNFIPFSPEHYKIEEINDKPLSYWEAQGMFGADK